MSGLSGAPHRDPVDTSNPSFRSHMRQVLVEHYFARSSPGYLESPEGQRDLEDHIDGRYHMAADHVVPWINRKFDLSGMNVIEIGSGTGSSTLAFAKATKSIDCFELSDASTATARERLGFWGIANVRFHSLFDEDCEFVRSGGTADAVLLYATLEHMTHEECLAILGLSWRTLRPGGILVVAETPNRFSMVDEHTSRLPFFSQLPREIQLRYAFRSPRPDFRQAMKEAEQEGKDTAIESLTRWGSGISFHEFELAIGSDFHGSIVLDGYESDIVRLFPVSAIDRALQDLFQDFDVPAHRAFTRRTLFLVAEKGRRSPEPEIVTRNRRAWKQISLAGDIVGIPTHSSAEERQYVDWLVAEAYGGWGAIVEVGVGLGNGSAALASGLRLRHSSQKVRCFDCFRLEPELAMVAGPGLSVGEDSLPRFLRETREHAFWIEARKVDRHSAALWDGGAIEILILDFVKTWESINAILKAFGPYLQPGQSRVVLRNFRQPDAYCLPLIFDSRPDVWEQVEDVEVGTTVTFRPLRPMDGPGGIDPGYGEASFPAQSANRLFRQRIAREEFHNRRYLLGGLFRKYMMDGPLEEALRIREEARQLGVDESALQFIGNVSPVLCPQGWEAFQQRRYENARRLAERCVLAEVQPNPHVLTLLGFSLLRLGDAEGARRIMDEALAVKSDHIPARLLGVELSIFQGQNEAAAAEALQVLREHSADESTVQWCLCLAAKAWSLESAPGSHVELLGELAASIGQSSSLLTYLAAEQYSVGQKLEAIKNLKTALAIDPANALAISYYTLWVD